jgi:hypothetical protein
MQSGREMFSPAAMIIAAPCEYFLLYFSSSAQELEMMAHIHAIICLSYTLWNGAV